MALVAGRDGMAAAAVAAWVVGRAGRIARREPSWRRRAKVLPLDLLVDAVSAAALVVGSTRARRLVL
jgi:NAD(P)H-hydrate repair Nnr-like enzyme with NAD(P)H-hydrate dehydratase domain